MGSAKDTEFDIVWGHKKEDFRMDLILREFQIRGKPLTGHGSTYGS